MKEPRESKEEVCPDCGSKDTRNHGFVLTKKWGNRRRRKCYKCASTFYEKQEVKNV